MKTESKISFPLYKICYSLAFVVVLSLVRGVSSVAEIGNVMQQAMGILAVVFYADTYMQEVQSSRAEVFGLYSMRKKLRVVYTRLAVQTAYLYGVSILGYGCFFWQRPVSSWDGDPAWVSFLMYLAAMPAMSSIVMMAKASGSEGDYAMGGIFVTTVCSIVSIPVVFWVLQQVAQIIKV